MSIYNCPNCGGENTEFVKLVYAKGHARNTTVREEVVGYNVTTETKLEENFCGNIVENTKVVSRTPQYGTVFYDNESLTDIAKEFRRPVQPEKPVFVTIEDKDYPRTFWERILIKPFETEVFFMPFGLIFFGCVIYLGYKFLSVLLNFGLIDGMIEFYHILYYYFSDVTIISVTCSFFIILILLEKILHNTPGAIKKESNI